MPSPFLFTPLRLLILLLGVAYASHRIGVHPHITAAALIRDAVEPRQQSTCQAGLTACADGSGCCPEGDACTRDAQGPFCGYTYFCAGTECPGNVCCPDFGDICAGGNLCEPGSVSVPPVIVPSFPTIVVPTFSTPLFGPPQAGSSPHVSVNPPPTPFTPTLNPVVTPSVMTPTFSSAPPSTSAASPNMPFVRPTSHAAGSPVESPPESSAPPPMGGSAAAGSGGSSGMSAGGPALCAEESMNLMAFMITAFLAVFM